MIKLGMDLFFYGYTLPLLVMLVWMLWRIYSMLKAKEKFVSYFIRSSWWFLIPGVSLFTVCVLLLFAIEESSYWLERHWRTWHIAAEKSRCLIRYMIDKNKED